MNAAASQRSVAPRVSIAIIAWNEEKTLGAMLEALFAQTLFAQLSARGQHCEVLCVANGCEDRTAEIAAEVFAEQSRSHPASSAFACRVLNLAQRGKLNAWNCFVHSLSARSAEFLFFMDADILLHERDTLWKMLSALERNREAVVSTDRPRKKIAAVRPKGFLAGLSLAAAQMTGRAEAQLCAQLYCIRAETARNIYLPRDLGACDDGFIKALVCTDFLMHPVWPWRIQTVDAAHTFEPYTSPRQIFRNQKRQMVGQTVVHLLVDKHLRSLSAPARMNLAGTLRKKDQDDPDWLKRLAGEHARHVKFFSLYPGLLTHRFKMLGKLSPLKRIACLPAAAAGTAMALISGFAAWKFLKNGGTQYWPRAERFSRPPENRAAPAILNAPSST